MFKTAPSIGPRTENKANADLQDGHIDRGANIIRNKSGQTTTPTHG